MVIEQVKVMKDLIENGEEKPAEPDDGDLDNDGILDKYEGEIDTSKHLVPMPDFVIKIKRVIAGRWFQLVLYFLQVSFLIALGFAVRSSTQYYLSRNVVALYIEGGWNDDHEIMADVRTPADLWEWGIACVIPSIFSNTDNAEAWPDGETTWPDGDVEFSEDGATPYTVSQLQEVYATMHTEMSLQIVRSKVGTGEAMFGTVDDGIFKQKDSEQTPYGFNFNTSVSTLFLATFCPVTNVLRLVFYLSNDAFAVEF